MSYSFTVRASGKSAAKQAVEAEFNKVVSSQSCHLRDRDLVLATSSATIDLVDEDPQRDVQVSVSGYLSGTWDGADIKSITTAAVSVSASLVAR